MSDLTPQYVVVDAGIPVQKFLYELDRAQVLPQSIDGIFITHEHGDHAGHINAYSKVMDVPVYMTSGTWEALDRPAIDRLELVNSLATVERDAYCAKAIPVCHDGRETVAWKFVKSADDQCPKGSQDANTAQSVGVLTDTGSISETIREHMRGCDILAIEFNYDQSMLDASNYPDKLRHRLKGNYGHLSNEQASAFVQGLTPAPKIVIACHVSENTNSAELVNAALSTMSKVSQKVVMPQRTASEWITL